MKFILKNETIISKVDLFYNSVDSFNLFDWLWTTALSSMLIVHWVSLVSCCVWLDRSDGRGEGKGLITFSLEAVFQLFRDGLNGETSRDEVKLCIVREFLSTLSSEMLSLSTSILEQWFIPVKKRIRSSCDELNNQ